MSLEGGLKVRAFERNEIRTAVRHLRAGVLLAGLVTILHLPATTLDADKGAEKEAASPSAEKATPERKTDTLEPATALDEVVAKQLKGAKEAIEGGRYEKGLKALENFLSGEISKEKEEEARALLVRACLETGKYKKAVTEATKLTELVPDSPSAFTIRAGALIEVGAYKEADKCIARALKLEEDNIDTRLLDLELARITGDRKRAKKQVDYFFNLYNQRQAKTAHALTAVARACGRKDPHGAFRAYQKAHKEDPKYIDAYLLAGFHCLDKYAWEYAQEEFAEVLKSNPNCALAHAGLANLYLVTNDYVRAQAAIEKALAINPNLGLAHELKAAMLAAQERNKESVREIRAALAVNPKSLSALSLLAAHHEALGQEETRDKVIAQVHAINPECIDLYAVLGQSSERRKRFPSAVKWGKKAIETDKAD